MVYDDDINFLPLAHPEKSPFHDKKPNNRTNKQVSLESFTRFSCSVGNEHTGNEQNNSYGCIRIDECKYYVNSYGYFN